MCDRMNVESENSWNTTALCMWWSTHTNTYLPITWSNQLGHIFVAFYPISSVCLIKSKKLAIYSSHFYEESTNARMCIYALANQGQKIANSILNFKYFFSNNSRYDWKEFKNSFATNKIVRFLKFIWNC